MNSIELFAGAGGLGIGISDAGFQPALVVERDTWCCDTIRKNQSLGMRSVVAWPVSQGDVRMFDFRPYEGRVRLVSGGPPCQPFSIGGKHRAAADARDMFPEAVRALREARPDAFLFENVRGLMRRAFEDYRLYLKLQMTHPEIEIIPPETWVEHLERLRRHSLKKAKLDLQYDVSIHLANAADYGVPQKRERVFFVGFRRDLGVSWNFPKPTHSKNLLAWQQSRTGEYWERHSVPMAERNMTLRYSSKMEVEQEDIDPWVTVRDAISDLPDPGRDSLASEEIPNHRFQPGARSYPGHTGSPLDEPAKTLKAGVHGVPGGENMLRRPDGTVRYFTVRESARLQTFPDNYIFSGSWSETMRQLGNAVPVRLAKIIAGEILSELEQRDFGTRAVQSA